jgi:predicted lipoprotein
VNAVVHQPLLRRTVVLPVVHRRMTLDVILRIVAVIVVLGAMVLGTKVVDLNSAGAAGPAAFDPATYGATEFPKLQQAIESRAVDATTLAAAIAADPGKAATTYGVAGGSGPIYSVRLTGVVGTGVSGVYPVAVPGISPDLMIRVQTGPAINGTDVRDATGTVAFGQFTDQIDYQNAASALNDQLRKTVLAPVDTAHLAGRTVTVIGAFQLINPKGWLITPVRLSVS